jgi:hypothetical protein
MDQFSENFDCHDTGSETLIESFDEQAYNKVIRTDFQPARSTSEPRHAEAES